MIKMFVSDIDGTMMQHGGLIDEQDIVALRSLAEQNVILCFASGRLDNEIADLMKAVNTNFHRISVNGVLYIQMKISSYYLQLLIPAFFLSCYT